MSGNATDPKSREGLAQLAHGYLSNAKAQIERRGQPGQLAQAFVNARRAVAVLEDLLGGDRISEAIDAAKGGDA